MTGVWRCWVALISTFGRDLERFGVKALLLCVLCM